MEHEKHEKDIEVGEKPQYHDGSDEGGAVRGEALITGNSWYHRMMRKAGKYGVEARGIERVPEDERTDNKHPYLNSATMVS